MLNYVYEEMTIETDGFNISACGCLKIIRQLHHLFVILVQYRLALWTLRWMLAMQMHREVK